MSTFFQHSRSFFKLPHFLRRRQGGFTVIELLMVVVIISALTGIFLLQQRQFDSTTLLRSLAYRTALAVREAQTYSASVRFSGSGAVQTPASAYGVYFSTASPTNYYLFADYNNDRTRASDGSEDIKTYTLNNGYSISKLCAVTIEATPVEKCSDSGFAVTSVTALFIRPNTDACMTTVLNPSACVVGNGGEDYSKITAQVRSPAGTTRSVSVISTGQIAVGSPGS